MTADAAPRPIVLSVAEYESACEAYEGVCLECGEITNSGMEPDARRYECEACGQRAVYGMEEALLMGLITIEINTRARRIQFTE